MFGGKMHGSSSASFSSVGLRDVTHLILLTSPDRWDTLSDAAKAQPGVYANVMTFSAGPRVCFFSTFVTLFFY
jgi:hypothetical protein